MFLNRRLALVFGAILALVVGLFVITRPVVAQQKGPTKFTEGRVVSRGNANAPDANIKTPRAPMAHKKGMVPASKGGAKTRGKSFGRIHVDSHVSVPVDIYIDGGFAGTVGVEGDSYWDVDSGSHDVYGKDADGCHWGPRTMPVYAGETSTLTLNDL